MTFDSNFELLTGRSPFPWQRALFARFVAGDFPKACDLPTGLGKTSVIALWVLALAENPKLPRRLVYVVNRRTVVDQATAEAEKIRAAFSEDRAAHLKSAFEELGALPRGHPLAISTLRGEFADNGEWRHDPARPAIIVGTVDMIGSRLLFSGYGRGFKSRPLHAGFLGHDALLVHDEAHLEPAFQCLLESICEAQKKEPRALRVLALSATGRTPADFTLSPDDARHPVVRGRLNADKRLSLHHLGDKNLLAERAAAIARERSGAVLVFLSSVENVEKCAALLRKAVGKEQVQVLTGTMRGAERDALVLNPVFARFRPGDSRRVAPREGTVYLLATSAGEVGIDISADHLVTDLPTFDALAQRLGRVNRYGEGHALVDVVAEPLESKPERQATAGEADFEEGDDQSGSRKKDYEWARAAARELLARLPEQPDGTRGASPAALRELPAEARAAASAPLPVVPAVDELLFDRWSFTSIRATLPGRPPVDDWLHGIAEWETPRTAVGWRREVAWLTSEHLGGDSLDDFLSDYPLRGRELLSDRTDRVVKHLRKIAERDSERQLRAWLVRDGLVEAPRDEERFWWRLVDLVNAYDPKSSLLNDALVLLSPEAGGLSGGLLDGSEPFSAGLPYDLGARLNERVVLDEAAEEQDLPGMRLVRAIRRDSEDDPSTWWKLFATPQAADDDGSRVGRYRQTLAYHLTRTEACAARIAQRLHLPASERQAVVLAARWHDLGKNRRVWQRSIKNFDYPASVYAKGRMQPTDLGHYRHELGSLHDAAKDPEFANLDAEVRDLTLHLIAAHHGRARPLFPPHEAVDPETSDAEVAATLAEVPLRFDRLQRRYGRWGLAWLESLLRAADYRASDEEEPT